MTIDKIIQYIFHTPLNTNKSILVEMLEQLIIDHGGSLETPEDVHIIYDGGIEK